MPELLSDEKVARQILAIFAEHHMASGGTLRRNHFFTVRDGDFQRELNKAVEKSGSALPSATATRTSSQTSGLPKSRSLVRSPAQPDRLNAFERLGMTGIHDVATQISSWPSCKHQARAQSQCARWCVSSNRKIAG
jgi:hypothetical protein